MKVKTLRQLQVKKLHKNAILPIVAHPGEDLGYDLFALEDTILPLNKVVRVRTGIAARAFDGDEALGLIVAQRSSMGSKGITLMGGVIDAGYTGEIVVMLLNLNPDNEYTETGLCGGYYRNGYKISAGDRIAQIRPTPVLTGQITDVDDLGESNRGTKGFGSSGL